MWRDLKIDAVKRKFLLTNLNCQYPERCKVAIKSRHGQQIESSKERQESEGVSGLQHN